ncbi:CDGSH iron-sulfur domain-containing protein [Mariniluteicoccus endophyticus]
MNDTAPGPSTRITAYPDGPLIVRGDVEVCDVEGRPLPLRNGPVALCRCGRSGDKPFCDGSHRLAGFKAP